MTSVSLAGWIDAALVGTACVGLLLAIFHRFPVRPALRHLAWLIVAVRFLVPAAPEWSWQPLSGQVDALVGVFVPTVIAGHGGQATRTLQAPSDEEERAGGPQGTIGTGISFIAPLWLLSALTLLCVRLGRYAQWRRSVGRGSPSPPWLERDVRVVAERLGVATPDVVVSRRVHVPLVAGVLRPVLVWPAGMQVQLDTPARRAVVAHEIAHLRRRDLWAGWIEMLLAAVWWWYPPALRICKELSAAADEACDRWVLSIFPDQRRSYAEALYAFAAGPAGPAVPRLAHPLSAHAVMKRRLEAVVREEGAPRTRPIERALVLVGAIAVLPVGVVTGSASPFVPDDSGMAGILGLGDVRVTPDGAPVAGGDGWIVAFRTNADGGFRAVFASVSGATVLDGTGERSAIGTADRVWLRRLVGETRWSVDVGSGVTSSGAVVPAGPHAHRASDGRTLAVWSGVARPFEDRGRLGDEATRAHPVVAALWSAGERVRLYRLWRDEAGRVRGERYGRHGRVTLADPAAVAAAVGAALR